MWYILKTIFKWAIYVWVLAIIFMALADLTIVAFFIVATIILILWVLGIRYGKTKWFTKLLDYRCKFKYP